MSERFSFQRVSFASITPATPEQMVPQALGRNGHLKTSGLELYGELDNGLVRITPYTSKGALAQSAYVEVPYHRATLRAMADKLMELAAKAP